MSLIPMKRSLFLAGFLALSLSSFWLLPPFRQVQSAISLHLPSSLGKWKLKEVPASNKERTSLAGDTIFAKALCFIPHYSSITGEVVREDVADLSIVLSGYDLANSIHRPERCMPAQGHEIYDSKITSIHTSDGKNSLPARRLLSNQNLTVKDPRKPEDPKATLSFRRHCVTYYFFVGEKCITEDHLQRTLIDIRDRLQKGQAQRWAYVSVTVPFQPVDAPKHPDPYVQGYLDTLPSYHQAETQVENLISDLATSNIDWSKIEVKTDT